MFDYHTRHILSVVYLPQNADACSSLRNKKRENNSTSTVLCEVDYWHVKIFKFMTFFIVFNNKVRTPKYKMSNSITVMAKVSPCPYVIYIKYWFGPESIYFFLNELELYIYIKDMDMRQTFNCRAKPNLLILSQTCFLEFLPTNQLSSSSLLDK